MCVCVVYVCVPMCVRVGVGACVCVFDCAGVPMRVYVCACMPVLV